MKHSASPAAVNAHLPATLDDVSRKLLATLAEVERIRVPDAATAAANPPVTEDHVRSILRARRHRSKFFKAELFADPAWDMLLHLYAAQLGQRRVSVSSLCTAAAVPPTTALRWINNLAAENLIVRSADRFDRRRIFVALSEEGRSAMSAYFAVETGGNVANRQ